MFGFKRTRRTPRPALSVLRGKAGLTASINEVIGAITLGVLVLGIGTVGLVATINYGEDSDAQSALAAVKTAQVTYEGRHGEYGTLEQLQSGDKPVLTGIRDGVKVSVLEDGSDFCATVLSKSMAGTQYLVAARGEVVELKSRFAPSALKGCYSMGYPVRMLQHGAEYTDSVPVPKGGGTACLRFDVEPGAKVTNWYIGAQYQDAEKKPTPNSAMINAATGIGYMSNGAMRPLSVDGYCFPVSADVKHIRWNFSSSAALTYGEGGLNTVGSTYRNIMVYFR